MHHTFQINTSQLGSSFVESVKSIFGNKEIKIVIEEVEISRQDINQAEINRFLTHRKTHPAITISDQGDFNDFVQDLNC
ncbi:hypothetical protein [Dyadobacter pollutisoli]|jgi:hypothetical protein|uniref:Uncharacterized protein n=1 Tax=Dyadobacter pollutisoli TaxID=2910158 RepID=A0A9E8SK45_9BACT|nr:hypothetical protein [Dyadobacter pollutisoli]WAC10844.1 hypothetical protein ON006_24250 [Dyadobacter pollutisoli]